MVSLIDIFMKLTTETKLLGLSAATSAVLGFAGSWAAIKSSSDSVLFDSIYSFMSAALSAMSLPVLGLLKRKDDRRFQFGYAAFEPFYVILSSMVIISAQAGIAYKAAAVLMSGGKEVVLSNVLLYEALSSSLCLGFALLMAIKSKNRSSPILRVEALSWLADGAISLGVLATFTVAMLLENSPVSRWLVYVDPALTLLLVAITAISLLKMTAEAILELLSAAPTSEIQEEAAKLLLPFRSTFGVKDISISLRKMGRSLDAHISIKLDQNISAMELAALSDAMTLSLRKYWPLGHTSVNHYFDPLTLKSLEKNRQHGKGKIGEALGLEALGLEAFGLEAFGFRQKGQEKAALAVAAARGSG